jgi:hypothetical protein
VGDFTGAAEQVKSLVARSALFEGHMGASRAMGRPTMQTTSEPISIGEETVTEKANDLALCKCIAAAPECSPA